MIEANFMSKGALGAYSKVQGLQDNSPNLPDVQNAEGKDFSEMVKSASEDAVETLRASDEAVVKGLRGEMGLQDVVEATLSAEATLTTVVHVRDKFVQAYQEVLRMPI